MTINQEQFNEWAAHPVTIELFADIKRLKAELTEQILIGVTIGDTAERTHGMTNRLIGQIAGLDQLLNISFSDDEENNN